VDHLDVLGHPVPQLGLVRAAHYGALDVGHLPALVDQVAPHRALALVYFITLVTNKTVFEVSVSCKGWFSTAAHVLDMSPERVDRFVRLIATRTRIKLPL
jgi:hypothetical protein